jgi:hypothetical protein
MATVTTTRERQSLDVATRLAVVEEDAEGDNPVSGSAPSGQIQQLLALGVPAREPVKKPRTRDKVLGRLFPKPQQLPQRESNTRPQTRVRDQAQAQAGSRTQAETNKAREIKTRRAQEVQKVLGIVMKPKQVEIQHIDEFEAQLETNFKRAAGLIFSYLTGDESPLPEDSVAILRGRAPEPGNPADGTAKTPYITIVHADFADAGKLQRFHLEFTSKGRSQMYRNFNPPFQVSYQASRSYAATGDAVAFRTEPSEYTLCGVLATTGDETNQRDFTIGGLLEVKGELWALTGWHHEQDGLQTRSKKYPVKRTEDVIEELLEKNQLAENLEPPTVVAPRTHQAESLEGATVAGSDKLTIPGDLGTIGRTGSEWALISIEDPRVRRPNCVEISAPVYAASASSTAPSQRCYLYEAAALYNENRSRTMVHVITGVSGVIKATISRTLSQMRLDSGDIRLVWTVTFANEGT